MDAIYKTSWWNWKSKSPLTWCSIRLQVFFVTLLCESAYILSSVTEQKLKGTKSITISELHIGYDVWNIVRKNGRKIVQLNHHETDQLFWYLSHHLTWHCLLISGFLLVLDCCDHKIVLHWYENKNKNNLVIMLCKSWETVRNQ